ncbi:hypothetical protein SRHO_G00044840 [Serrasalmus rhombeus]
MCLFLPSSLKGQDWHVCPGSVKMIATSTQTRAHIALFRPGCGTVLIPYEAISPQREILFVRSSSLKEVTKEDAMMDQIDIRQKLLLIIVRAPRITVLKRTPP